MNPLLTALVGLAGSMFGATLVYVATRKRDEPTLRVAREQATVSGAQAASEAWAEFATAVRQELKETRAELLVAEHRVDTLERNTRECKAEIKMLRARLRKMEVGRAG